MKYAPSLAGLAFLALAAWLLIGAPNGGSPPPAPPLAPAPPPAPIPRPAPNKPKPCPGPGPCPRWLGDWSALVTGSRHPDGAEIEADLPLSQHMRNCGGSDGAGLCVFTSISHEARMQNVPVLKDFRDWMKRYPGGGFPSKVDLMIGKISAEKGVPAPEYLQVEGGDLEILRLACRTGRMPAVTYSVSPTGRYGGRHISHMVSLVAAGVGQGPDGKGWWVILDNNFPGSYEWMSEAEFRRAYAPGWCVILLAPPAPPPPHN